MKSHNLKKGDSSSRVAKCWDRLKGGKQKKKYISNRRDGEGAGVDLPLQEECSEEPPIHHIIYDYPFLSLKTTSADDAGEGAVLPSHARCYLPKKGRFWGLRRVLLLGDSV